jgi:hypothetical protein
MNDGYSLKKRCQRIHPLFFESKRSVAFFPHGTARYNSANLYFLWYLIWI